MKKRRLRKKHRFDSIINLIIAVTVLNAVLTVFFFIEGCIVNKTFFATDSIVLLNIFFSGFILIKAAKKKTWRV